MQGGERCQDRATARRERQLDLAPVRARGRPRHDPLLHQPVDEADRAVVLDEELGGEIPIVTGRSSAQPRTTSIA